MRPYERRRDGEVAGTVGNTAPSFPVSRDNENAPPDAGLQAAAPPVLGAAYLSPFEAAPVVEERAGADRHFGPQPRYALRWAR